jgi:ActR/RegA family two-component response regulator
MGLGSANILLVDDEIPFVNTLSRHLSKRELKIVTAFRRNGRVNLKNYWKRNGESMPRSLLRGALKDS